VYLGLGANLEDREASILSALKELDALPTITMTAVSSFYETAPVGVTDQPNFVNAVAEVRTTLTPDALLETVLALEKNRGRVRTQRWGPRVIDIDILLYGNVQRETPALTLPHPRLEERDFVLVPLAEIAPNLVLPGQTSFIKNKAETLQKNGNILAVKHVELSIPVV
jgi:2-amino-4-hydroxy-6-hydroxymethyldihydropteridine diphosphokinase